MSTRIAFVGFRHPHIFDMLQRCHERPDTEVVACCEEDEATRQTLAENGKAEVTHDDHAAMLDQVGSDVVAVGDYYGKRGQLLIAALEAGRHVISDKPICTSLDELDRIEQLASEKNLAVGCMLDMRDQPFALGLRELIRGGEIGNIAALSFGGQHPLNYGTRPAWYFERGKHGGTINDIAVHAIDFIPWATGLNWQRVEAARCWNSILPQVPHFEECGQALLTLDNNAGVQADVSYLLPKSHGYGNLFYWRFTFWGEGGLAEAGFNTPDITLYKEGETEPRKLPLPDARPGGYLDSFLAEVRGDHDSVHLSSADALAAARNTLTIQHAADSGQHAVSLG